MSEKSLFRRAWKVVLFALVASVVIGLVVPLAMSYARTEEYDDSLGAQTAKRREASEARRAARAKAFEDRRQEIEESRKRLEVELEERRIEEEKERAALIKKLAEQPKKKRKVRRIRRFKWESPAEARGRIWNVPEEETEEAVLTAFLRVCFAESSGRQQDCVGIWQVVRNNRWRTCDRAMIRRISECEEGEGETLLSALRRHQRHALGMIKARNVRGRWIRNMTIDCENPPEGFPGKTEQKRMDVWDASYQRICNNIVADGRYLIKGELPPARPGNTARWLKGRPITWGGRCETGKASCDDRMACERGLARIPDTNTLNAFWCVVGRRGCRSDPEPVCLALGYKYGIGKGGRPSDKPIWKTVEEPTKNEEEPIKNVSEAEPTKSQDPTS